MLVGLASIVGSGLISPKGGMMRPVVVPLAILMVATLGCGSSSKSPPDPGNNPGAGGSGGDPVGGGPDGGIDDPDGGTVNTACSRVGSETRLTTTGSPARMPAIAWDGSGYLVVWSDERQGNGDIYAAKVDANGTKSSEWVVVEGPEQSRSPTIARVGDGYVVAWFDTTPIGADVKIIALDSGGKPSGMPSLLAASTSDNPRPIVAPAFNGAAVAWSDKKGTVPSASVALVNGSAQLTVPAVSLGNGTAAAEFPAPAGGDGKLAVFYSDGRDGHANIRATLFSEQLTAQQDVVVRDAPNDAFNVRATWDGEQFVAAWEDLRVQDREYIFLSRLSPSGTASNSVTVPESDADGSWPTLARAKSGVAIAYYQFRGGPPQIFVSYMNKAGDFVRSDVQVSQTTGRARFPSIAFDGNSTLGVAWEDTRAGHQEVYFARVQCP